MKKIVCLIVICSLLILGGSAHAFTTRIINETDSRFICTLWVYNVPQPIDEIRVDAKSTKDIDVGWGCQREFRCFQSKLGFKNWMLSSGDMGPQCWSRNIYLKLDKANKTFYWEWTAFH